MKKHFLFLDVLLLPRSGGGVVGEERLYQKTILPRNTSVVVGRTVVAAIRKGKKVKYNSEPNIKVMRISIYK